MRALRATIDCYAKVVTSPLFSQSVPLTLTNKGLFLIDINQVAISAARASEKSVYSQVADSSDHPMSQEKKSTRAAPVPSDTEDNLLNQTCWKSPTPSRHDKPQVSFMAAVENRASAAEPECTDSGSCTAVSAQRSSTSSPEIGQSSGSPQHVSPEPSAELA